MGQEKITDQYDALTKDDKLRIFKDLLVQTNPAIRDQNQALAILTSRGNIRVRENKVLDFSDLRFIDHSIITSFIHRIKTRTHAVRQHNS